MSQYTPPTLPEAARATGRPIESAPQDRPILAWLDHEADTYQEDPSDPKSTRLTLYAAHYEGMSHAPTGWAIVEWGGAFDDTSWEDFHQAANLPDWWFVKDSEFEVAANPVLWWPLPGDETAEPQIARLHGEARRKLRLLNSRDHNGEGYTAKKQRYEEANAAFIVAAHRDVPLMLERIADLEGKAAKHHQIIRDLVAICMKSAKHLPAEWRDQIFDYLRRKSISPSSFRAALGARHD